MIDTKLIRRNKNNYTSGTDIVSVITALCEEIDRLRAELEELRKNAMCEECGVHPTDYPSKYCAGCNAYREHTGV